MWEAGYYLPTEPCTALAEAAATEADMLTELRGRCCVSHRDGDARDLHFRRRWKTIADGWYILWRVGRWMIYRKRHDMESQDQVRKRTLATEIWR